MEMPQVAMGQEADKEASRDWLFPFIATIPAMPALRMSNLGSSPLLKEAQKEFRMSASLNHQWFVGVKS